MKITINNKNIIKGAFLQFLIGDILVVIATLLYYAYLLSPLNQYLNEENIKSANLADGQNLDFFVSLAFSWLVAGFWWFPITVMFVARLDRENAEFYNSSVFTLAWLIRLGLYTPLVAYAFANNPAAKQGPAVELVSAITHIPVQLVLLIQGAVTLTLILGLLGFVIKLSRNAFIKEDAKNEPLSAEEIDAFEKRLDRINVLEKKAKIKGTKNIPFVTPFIDGSRANVTRDIVLRLCKSPGNWQEIPKEFREKMTGAWDFRLYFLKQYGVAALVLLVGLLLSSLYPKANISENAQYNDLFSSIYEKIEPPVLIFAGFIYAWLLSATVIKFTKGTFGTNTEHQALMDNFLYLSGAYLRNTESTLVALYLLFLFINNTFFSRFLHTKVGPFETYAFLTCLSLLILALFIAIYKYFRHIMVDIGDRYCTIGGNSPGEPGYVKSYTRYFAAILSAAPIAFLFSQILCRSIAALLTYLFVNLLLKSGTTP